MYSALLGELNAVNSPVSGPSGSKLNVLGKIDTSLKYKGESCNTEVYVIKGLSKPLLGRPVLEPLQILKRLFKVSIGWIGIQKFSPG